MSKLVIIEAPGKLKKFRSYLGSDYSVVATVGHISDLPAKGLNVDIKNDFEPTYGVYPEKKDVVKDIKAKAKNADVVYLMTDEDREGEAIAFHVSNILPKGTKIKRAKTGSITKSAIEKAIADAGDIDMHMVSAYEARRILDRLAGYKTSYVVKQATGGPSAGRTQSAGLRILAEREKEIQNFVPIVYYPIEAELLTKKNEKVVALIKIPKPLDINTKEQADKIIEVLKSDPIQVSKFDKKKQNDNPYPPFTTSTMYQSAASVFGWSTDKTASVAQKLYEAGVITYHRTDSTYVIPEAVNEARTYIQGNFAGDYLPKSANIYKNKAGAQEAHEACRAVNVSDMTYTSGGAEQAKLYKMIWKRTVASQMTPAQFLRISAEFSCDKYVLSASGSKMLFDGYRAVWDYGASTDKELPEMEVGDPMKLIDVKTERKETQPPPRYNNRSFVKKLEDEGIGRPSTYASIPKTLVARKYIESGKNMKVTELGMKVNDFLVTADFCFADIKFTSHMEEGLDQIASNKKSKIDLLTEFWDRLKTDIEKAKGIRAEESKTEFKCPKCEEEGREAYLVKRNSRYGAFYSCENFKKHDCKYKADIGEDEKPVEKVVKKVEPFGMPCPKCGEDMVIRESKYGKFAGCSGYPKCKTMMTMEGELIVPKKKKWGKKKKD